MFTGYIGNKHMLHSKQTCCSLSIFMHKRYIIYTQKNGQLITGTYLQRHCIYLNKTVKRDPVFSTIVTSCPFLKTAGGIILGSVAVSAVSAVSADVLLYISVAIKASFLKLGMCNICKNNIAKMFLDFFKM